MNSPRHRNDFKLEVVVLPVSDVERTKRFYGSTLGWRQDADFAVGDQFRVLQFTPPGSPSSIHFGKGLTSAAPGSAGLYLVVSDIDAARAELLYRGVEVSEVSHRAGPGKPAISGRDPERRSYASFATFRDPDGNSWLLQEINARLPGRVDTNQSTFTSSGDLAVALKRAAAAHGEHEKRNPGQKHDDWPEWYSEYLFAEQTGNPPPT